MVAIGAVRREGPSTFAISNGARTYTVFRNEDREVVCDCSRYLALHEQDEQCEHILAVKEFVSKGEPTMAKAVREKVKEVEETEEETTFDNQVEDANESPGTERFTPNYKPSWFLKLQESLPKSLIKNREGWKAGGKTVMVDYIEWTTAVHLLNAALGASWSWEIVSSQIVGNEFVIHGRLRVQNGMTYTSHDGIGTGTLKEGKEEVGVKGAESDALKRAATKFGLGLELYDKDGDWSVPAKDDDNMVDEPFDNPKPNKAKADSAVAVAAKRQKEAGNGGGANPNVATSLMDKISDKQISWISGQLAEQADIENIDQECQDVMGCVVEELSKKGASKFIDHLKEKA
jgi:hypothetical protein